MPVSAALAQQGLDKVTLIYVKNLRSSNVTAHCGGIATNINPSNPWTKIWHPPKPRLTWKKHQCSIKQGPKTLCKITVGLESVGFTTHTIYKTIQKSSSILCSVVLHSGLLPNGIPDCHTECILNFHVTVHESPSKK